MTPGMTPEAQAAAAKAQALIDQAYTDVLATEAGQVVFEDLLLNLHHMRPTEVDDERVLQQFALWLLRRSGLHSVSRGSFPHEYVSALVRIKLQQPPPEPKPAPEPKVKSKGLLGRLLKGIF